MTKSRLKIAIAILAVALAAAMSLALFTACDEQEVVKRTVTFMNGDEVFETQEVTLGDKYSLPDRIPEQEQPDDEHELQFVGWTLDDNYYEYRSEIITEPDFVVADIVIYAAFRKVAIADTPGQGADKEYEVEFRMPVGEDFGELSGVTLDRFTQHVKRYKDADIPDPDDMPSVTGYHFTGEWTGGTLTNVRGRRRVTAVYERNLYTLTLHYLGETSAREMEYRAPVDLTELPQVDEAFVFDGWYTDSDFQTEASLTEMPDGDVDLYAKYHIDFSTASVSREGTMVYGDVNNNLYVSGLKECDGLEYTFTWTVNGQTEGTSSERNRRIKNVGTYNVQLHIFANYKDGVLTDQADARTADNSIHFEFTIVKATLTGVVTLQSDSVVYGQAAPAASIVYSGFVFDETAESVNVVQQFVYMQGDKDVTGANLHVGSYRVETFPQEHPNYEFAPIQARQFEVTPKDLDVTAKVSDYVYGAPLAFDIDIDGFVFDEDESVLGRHWFTLNGEGEYVGGEHLHVGNYSAQLQGYQSSDYNVRLPAAVNFNVIKRAGSVRLTANGGVYGVRPSVTVEFDNVLAEDQSRFTPVYTYTRSGNPYSSTNRFVVGDYFVTATFTENGFDDYQTLSVTGDSFSVSPKPVNVYVSVQDSYAYGDSVIPSLSYEDAFEFGESAADSGLISGDVRYTYRTASDGKPYEFTRFGVNDYTVEASGLTADNYVFRFPVTEFSVTKRDLQLTVHLEKQSILYGLNPQVAKADDYINGISYEGFVFDESPRSIFGSNLPTVYYLDSHGQRATQFHAGIYTATTSADPQNYNIVVNTATLTVTRRTLSIDIVLSQTEMVYGNKPTTATIVYTREGYDGFVSAEERTRYTSSAYVMYKGAANYTQTALGNRTTKMAAGTYKLSVEGIDRSITDDYDVTYLYQENGLTFTITPATLNVTLSTNAHVYTYGNQPNINVTYRGFVYNEDETQLFGDDARRVVYRNEDTGSLSYERLGAGDYTATLEGIVNANYTINITDCNITIIPTQLRVIVRAEGFTYGNQAKPEPQISYVGFVYGDDVSDIGGEPVFTYKRGVNGETEYVSDFFDAGDYIVTVSGLQSDNYTLYYVTNDNNHFTVAKRDFTATLSAQSITYGEDANYGYETTGVLDRDSDSFGFRCVLTYRSGNMGMYQPYDPDDYAHYQAGNYVISLEYDLNSNYNALSSKPTASFAVQKKQLTVTVTVDDFTYGAAAEPVVSQEGLVDGDEDLLADPAFYYTGAYREGIFHAGEYSVTITGLTSNNYNIDIIGDTFSVAKAAVTVTVTAEGYTYGEHQKPNPSLNYGPLFNGDKESVLGTPTFTYKRSATVGGEKVDYSEVARFAAGYYTVGVSGLSSSDYDITIVTADIVIGKASLTVSVSANGFMYDGEKTPVPSLSYEGFVNDENYSVLDGTPHYEYSGNVIGGIYHAGEYTVTVGGYTSDNYDITYQQGSFTVSPRQVVITLANGWTTYAQDPSAYTWYTLGGDSVLNDELTFTVSLTKNGSSYTQGSEKYFSVGAYTVTVVRSANSDYVVKRNGEEVTNSTQIQFTVAKARLIVTANGDSDIPWGDSASWSATPSINDNRFSISGTIAMTEGKHSADNYDIKEGHLGDNFRWLEECKITLEDGTDVTDNFELVYTITLTLNTSKFVVTTPSSVQFDGKEHTFAVTAKATDVDAETITYKYTVDGEPLDGEPKFTNAGTYTIHYEISAPNTDPYSSDFTVEITKANITVSKQPSDVTGIYQSGKDYFEAVSERDIKGVEADSGFKATVLYGKEPGNYTSPSLTLIDVADSGMVYYKVSAGDNYNDFTGSYKVTIGKATVPVPEIGRKTYNKTNQTAEISSNDYYDVTTNNGGTVVNADGYDVVLTLKDSDNYKWSDNSEQAAITLKFYIDKAPVDRPTANGTTFTYNATPQTYTPVGFVEETMTISGNEQTNAYTYTVTVSLADPSNYKWSDDKAENSMFTFVIGKAAYQSVTVEAAQSYNYDTAAHGTGVTFTGVDGEASPVGASVKYSYDSKSNLATAPTFTDYQNGGYTINYTISGNSNYDEASGNYTITINKIAPAIELPQQEDLVAELKAKGIEIEEQDGSKQLKGTYNKSNQGSNFAGAVQIQYFSANSDADVEYALETVQPAGISLAADLQWTKDIAEITIKNAGSYKLHVKVSGKNYKENDETFVIVVDKAQGTIDTSNIRTTYTYDGKEHTITGATCTGDGTLSYSNNTFKDVPVNGLDREYGTFDVTVTLSEGNNYLGTEAKVTITVNKAQGEIDTSGITNKTYTYLGIDQTVVGAVAKGLEGVDLKGIGDISYSNNTFKDVPEGGTLLLTVTLSNGTNYLGKSATVSINVGKANYIVTADNQSFPYNGKDQGNPITVKGVGNDTTPECTVTYNGDEDTVAQYTDYKDGGYTVKYTISGNSNYNDVSGGSYNIMIEKATPQLKDFADEEIYTYSKGTAHVDQTKVDKAIINSAAYLYGDQTVEYKVEKNNGLSNYVESFTAISDAGTYVITVKVTGNNYNDVTATYSFTILPQKLTVKMPSDVTGTYNGSEYGRKGIELLGTTDPLDDIAIVTYSYDEGQDGNIDYNGNTAPSFVDVISVSVSVSVTSKNDNYTFGTDGKFESTYSVNIAKAKISVTIERYLLTPNYDKSSHFIELDKGVKGVTIDGLYGDDHITVTYSKEETSAPCEPWDIIDINQYTVWYTIKVMTKDGKESGNYEILKDKYTINVTQAVLHQHPDGVSHPLEGKVIPVKLGLTLNELLKLQNLDTQWGVNAETVLNQQLEANKTYTFTATYLDSDGINMYEFDVTFTTRKENVTAKPNGSFETNFGTAIDPSTIPNKFIFTHEDGTNLTGDEIKLITGSLSAYDNTCGGTYSVQVTLGVTSDNSYFNLDNTTFDVIVKVKSVMIGNTYYTIEDALREASKGTTITVKYNTSFATTEVAELAGYSVDNGNYTVKDGVTLLLPYDGDSGINKTTTTSKTPAFNQGTFKKVELTIVDDITLYNNGTITIGGITTGQQGGYSGCTAEDYAQITMGRNAIIQSNGDINAYGYIAESEENNGSQVVMNSGTLLMPFIVREHRGGTQFLSMVGGMGAVLMGGDPSKNLQTSPFNTFYMENIHAKLTFSADSNLKGHANLYANNRDNTTDIDLVGMNNHLLNLFEGAKLIAKYSPSTGVTKIEMKGDVKLNSLSLSLSMGMTITISTQYVYFPISWRYDVTLSGYEDGRNATFDTTAQKIKLLPGAKLTVSKGTTLNVSELVVYDNKAISDFTDPSQNYEKKTESAILIVDGTLTAQSLAGVVQTTQDGAVIQVSNNTITTKELQANASTYKTITTTLMGKQDGGSVETTMSAGKYMSNKGTWYNGNTKFSIEYKFRKDNGDGTFSDISVGSVDNPNSTTYALNENIMLQNPTSGELVFMGWFLDENGTGDSVSLIESEDHFGGITLYGIFKEMSADELYTINFDTSYNDKSSSGLSIDSKNIPVEGFNFDPVTDEGVNKIICSLDEEAKCQYYFSGWYLDEARTRPYSVETFKEDNPNGGISVTLYAKWAKKYEVSVTSLSNASVTVNGLDLKVGGSLWFKPGETITVNATYTENESETLTISPDIGVSGDFSSKQFTINEDRTIVASSKASCIVEGTLIMLADGTQKPVEDLLLTDLVLTFNHMTGQFEAKPLNLIAHMDGSAAMHRVINLQFSDGSVLGIVLEHGLFDLTVNKYVFISEENMNEFVGHSFSKVNSDNSGYHTVTLVRAFVTEEVIRIFSPTSQGNVNIVADGLLTLSRIPFGAEELLNMFDFGDGMKYDEAKMIEDIEKYGVYTYEDFAEYMTYEEFVNSPVAYLKIGVGKGLVTYEQIIQLLEYQKRYME